MTVYNGGAYLRSSIQSILKQTYTDFEFVIVNNCSTDNSLEIIESFKDDRIIIHNNKENFGQTKALNIGLKLAKGKYVARMDADDMAFPTWLDKSVDYIRRHPEYVAVGASATVINETGKFKKVQRTPTTFEGVIFHIFFGNAINHAGSLFNKEIVLKNGCYNEEFRVSQDYELWSSLIRSNYCLTNVGDILVAIRVHKSSVSYVAEKNRGLEEAARIIYRNIEALTTLKVTFEDAVKLRLFYRFPEQLTREDFEYARDLYEKIFYNLKDSFKIEQGFLMKKLKKQMLIPFCKRAVSNAEDKRPGDARRVILYYLRQYGFHFMPVVILLMSFLSISAVKGSMKLFSKLSEALLKLQRIGVKA